MINIFLFTADGHTFYRLAEMTETDEYSPKSYLLIGMVICSFKCINLSLKANKDKHSFLPTGKSSACDCDSRGTVASTRARYGN